MHFLLKMVIFHCYVSLPEGTCSGMILQVLLEPVLHLCWDNGISTISTSATWLPSWELKGKNRPQGHPTWKEVRPYQLVINQKWSLTNPWKLGWVFHQPNNEGGYFNQRQSLDYHDSIWTVFSIPSVSSTFQKKKIQKCHTVVKSRWRVAPLPKGGEKTNGSGVAPSTFTTVVFRHRDAATGIDTGLVLFVQANKTFGKIRPKLSKEHGVGPPSFRGSIGKWFKGFKRNKLKQREWPGIQKFSLLMLF